MRTDDEDPCDELRKLYVMGFKQQRDIKRTSTPHGPLLEGGPLSSHLLLGVVDSKECFDVPVSEELLKTILEAIRPN